MKRLLIYVPTYNREQSLRVCVERLLAAVTPVQEEVAIHVSDNQSTDGTQAYLQSLNHPALTHSRNPENLGAARNVLKALTLRDRAEFTWIMGDDDYVVADAPARLLAEIRLHPQVDFYFLNTHSFSDRYRDRAVAAAQGGSMAKGRAHSRMRKNFDCSLRELFDPRIDHVLMGAVMCYAFRSTRVADHISEKITVTDLSQPEACYPHTLAWLNSLGPHARCRHLHEAFTVNVWHQGSDWGVNGYDWAVTHGLGHVLYEAIRLGYVEPAKKRRLLSHYLSLSNDSYAKLSAGAIGRGMLFSPSVKDELLEMLLGDALGRHRAGHRPRLRAAAKRIISKFRPTVSSS